VAVAGASVADGVIHLPGDHHGVGANASETEPSKLPAVFVVDTDETELVTPDPK
jgi:hypothetical protein